MLGFSSRELRPSHPTPKGNDCQNFLERAIAGIFTRRTTPCVNLVPEGTKTPWTFVPVAKVEKRILKMNSVDLFECLPSFIWVLLAMFLVVHALRFADSRPQNVKLVSDRIFRHRISGGRLRYYFGQILSETIAQRGSSVNPLSGHENGIHIWKQSRSPSRMQVFRLRVCAVVWIGSPIQKLHHVHACLDGHGGRRYRDGHDFFKEGAFPADTGAYNERASNGRLSFLKFEALGVSIKSGTHF